MISIYVKGDPVAAAQIIGQSQLKSFNHPIRFHDDIQEPHHAVLDLTINNAASIISCLLADTLAEAFTKYDKADLSMPSIAGTFLCTAKARFTEWQGQGYPGGDSDCIPLLELINTHPRYATTWSCAGHGMLESPPADGNVKRSNNQGYVSITGSVKDLILLDLYLKEFITKAPYGHYTAISVQRTQTCLAQTKPLFALPFIYYPAITIRWSGQTQSNLDARRTKVFDLLTAALADG